MERTSADHPDSRLRGRRYAIPFAAVWEACEALAGSGLRGWEVVRSDEAEGVLTATATSWLFRWVDDVQVRVSLDEDGQTRVDLSSASRTGRSDLGANRRRIVRFLRRLDRRLGIA